MPNYSNGKIYKIVCNKTNKMYIGSTTKQLSKRLSGHKYEYLEYKSGRQLYKMTSYDVLENEDYDIILIENFPCKTKYELLEREKHFITSNECVNKFIPNRTKKEHYESNKDNIAVKKKEYRLLNHDKIYAETVCSCGKTYSHKHKARHLKSTFHTKHSLI